ncbi:putative salt tolerance-like protein [Acorus gramineus]|uniref:Salt tolerance-like protein n=1 Tax=Acorus gramineus TaxID=55184 RepID=A0AAV9ABM9_ACOGR|nr:putative salt tolerance-like protein [Acorus gramineus]
MKIQCDVCGGEEASVFCTADEAALCGVCDRRVHHANKLAGKHRRLALLNNFDAPLCDVCQERRAFLFCEEDRAILCSECDGPIHASNHHNRFLLTGVKVLSSPPIHSDTTDTTTQSVVTTTSISDYLMKTLPGWCVEDLLDSADGFSDVGHLPPPRMDDGLPFIEADCVSQNPMWVPQVPQWVIGFHGQCDTDKSRRRTSDHGGFRVPRISPPPCKRSR